MSKNIERTVAVLRILMILLIFILIMTIRCLRHEDKHIDHVNETYGYSNNHTNNITMNAERLINLFGDEWYIEMEDYLRSDDFKLLMLLITQERFSHLVNIYPSHEDIFKCFRLCPYSDMKVVILGQDPYHDGSADGLAFSNSKVNKLSPSLRNILKEANSKVIDGDLSGWAKQGILLLNTAQTVVKSEPESHLNYWKSFTNKVIETINTKHDVIWLLLGAKAHSFEPLIHKYHCVLKTSHPSPFSAYKGFIGSNIFKLCNEELEKRNIVPINW